MFIEIIEGLLITALILCCYFQHKYYLNSKLSEKNSNELIKKVFQKLVREAEVKYKQPGQGKSKKQYVLEKFDYLQDYILFGINSLPADILKYRQELNKLIEKSVEDMKNGR